MKQIFLSSSINFVVGDIIRHTPKAKGMSLAFISTAAESETGDKKWLKDDRQGLMDAGFAVFDYTVTGKTAAAVKNDLSPVDVIFFSGGNTFYLLEKMQQSGCINIIRDFVQNGKIYIGSSAGSVVAGPDISPAKRIDDPQIAIHLQGYAGLGLVDFVTFPHWGSDNFRELYLNHRLKHAYTANHKIILLTDYQYILVADEMYKIIEVKH